jgi:hypothetical protein
MPDSKASLRLSMKNHTVPEPIQSCKLETLVELEQTLLKPFQHVMISQRGLSNARDRLDPPLRRQDVAVPNRIGSQTRYIASTFASRGH